MPLAGEERLVIILTTSDESIVAKERNFLDKLIDDFGKFKLYQINFAGYRFDYRTHLAGFEIKSKNIIQQQEEILKLGRVDIPTAPFLGGLANLELINGVFLVDKPEDAEI
jgi:hypothetical protein